MAPGDLQEVLEALKPAGRAHPDLLVGLAAADDAAVYRITSDFAIVETVDFFPPVVDDPWTWGAISAANSMSDVFAMGGEVLFALAVAGFPREMSKAIIAEVFRGGSDKVVEAGGVIAGGHTVVDNEPKYGLCVTGRVHPDRILIKGGLRPGDRLFLSKPLGTGVITTAAKDNAARAEVLDGAIKSMLRLNHVAAEVAREAGARGATDITGFGLLGHAGEMVKAPSRRHDQRVAPASASGNTRARRSWALEWGNEAQPPPHRRGLRPGPPHRSLDPRIPRLPPRGIGDIWRPPLLGRARSRTRRDRRVPPPQRGGLGAR